MLLELSCFLIAAHRHFSLSSPFVKILRYRFAYFTYPTIANYAPPRFTSISHRGSCQEFAFGEKYLKHRKRNARASVEFATECREIFAHGPRGTETPAPIVRDGGICELSSAWCIGPPLQDSLAELLRGRASADEALRLYRKRFASARLPSCWRPRYFKTGLNRSRR